MDTKFFYYNKKMLAKAGRRPGTLRHLGRRADRGQGGQGQGRRPVPAGVELVAGRGDHLRLHPAGRRLRRSVPRRLGQSGDQHRVAACQALEWMRQTIIDGLTNPASTTFLEGDVEKTMNNGQAAFGLNWTYYLGSSNTPAQLQGRRRHRVRADPGRPDRPAARRQRRHGDRDHSGQQEPGRRLEVHRVPHQRGPSWTSTPQEASADLEGVVHRPGRRGDGAGDLRGGGQAARRHDPAAAGGQLQRRLPGHPGRAAERPARQEDRPEGTGRRGQARPPH